MSHPRPLTIGVIATVSDSTFHTPLFEAVSAEIARLGARLVFVLGTPAWMLQTQIGLDLADGWMIINVTEGAEQLAARGRPVVLVSASAGDLPSVLPDNRSGTAAAIDHLVALGRRRIAFMGIPGNPDFRERLAAYREQLAAHGITPDEQLIIDPGGYNVIECQNAMAALLRGGVAPDAVFGANDWAAIGAVQAARAAGLRVPEDMAVVGFDDSVEAPYHDPPLSSVRQRPDELGRVALRLLIAQLQRGQRPPPTTTVPTHLIVRRSSAPAAPDIAADASQRYQGAGWQAQLAADLVALALNPAQPDPGLPPGAIWEGVDQIVESLARVCDGLPAQPPPEHVWAAGLALANGGSSMGAALRQLRAAGYERQRRGAGLAATEAMGELLAACHNAVRRLDAAAIASQAQAQKLAMINETAIMRHFNVVNASPTQLDWLSWTSADWGTIGLVDRDAHAAPGQADLTITSVFERASGARAVARRITASQFPPADLIPPELRDSPEHILKITPLRTQARAWGYIAMLERFQNVGFDVIDNRITYIATMLERDELMRSLSDRQQTLQQAYERERGLADTIRELGCPIIPLMPGILLVPLVGAIDQQRAQQIIEQVLEGVSREQAEQVLLDITGVPLVDTHIAAALIQTARAVGLLGARITLVGVRPEIAQSIVSLNIDLGAIETRPTLAAALTALTGRR